jgi:hypothetical protein
MAANMNKTTEQLFQERNKRILDAIQLSIPDRVPVDLSFGYFPAKYTGITASAAYYEYDKWLAATKKTILDFEPDGVFYVQPFSPGVMMEYLEPRAQKWPGHGVPADHGHQAIEGEWMKPDEWDAFFEDQADYMLRVYLPRVVGAMEPFKNLPNLATLGYGFRGGVVLGEALANPEIWAAMEQLRKAGQESLKWNSKIAEFSQEIQKLGFPTNTAGAGGAPFDQVSDFLRGMTGTMLDMFRQPDKILKANEMLLERTLTRIAAMPQRTDNPTAFMALHRGSDGFMSLKQFEKFYWPGLKAVITAICEKGIIPGVFFEGNWTARLEYLLELPKGKVLGHFDSTDIFKAKEVLKGHMCIRGNVPGSLLTAGSVQEVKDYCKTLIDVVGKDGGLIVCPRVAPDVARPENVHAMIDFTKEYGVYR